MLDLVSDNLMSFISYYTDLYHGLRTNLKSRDQHKLNFILSIIMHLLKNVKCIMSVTIIFFLL